MPAKLPAAERKSVRLSIPVTRAERRRVKEAAGSEDVTAYVRRRLGLDLPSKR